MFHLVCFGWLLFRAPDLSVVARFVTQIATDFSLTPKIADTLFAVLFYPSMLWAIELWIRNADDPRTSPGWRTGIGAAVATLLFVLVWLLAAPSGADFIYFQF